MNVDMPPLQQIAICDVGKLIPRFGASLWLTNN